MAWVAWREGTEWHRMAWVAWPGMEWHGMACHGIGLNYTYKEILNALKTKGRCKYISLHFFNIFIYFFFSILLKMYLFFVTNTNYVCGVDTHCLHST